MNRFWKGPNLAIFETRLPSYQCFWCRGIPCFSSFSLNLRPYCCLVSWPRFSGFGLLSWWLAWAFSLSSLVCFLLIFPLCISQHESPDPKSTFRSIPMPAHMTRAWQTEWMRCHCSQVPSGQCECVRFHRSIWKPHGELELWRLQWSNVQSKIRFCQNLHEITYHISSFQPWPSCVDHLEAC